MKCGNTYLLWDDDSPDSKPHLHVVISDPDASGQIVLVSVTTRRRTSDTLVCLEVGDHPYIVHPSVITFAYSKILHCDRLTKLLADDDASPKADASAALVARIKAGMRETDRAPEEVRQQFLANDRPANRA